MRLSILALFKYILQNGTVAYNTTKAVTMHELTNMLDMKVKQQKYLEPLPDFFSLNKTSHFGENWLSIELCLEQI